MVFAGSVAVLCELPQTCAIFAQVETHPGPVLRTTKQVLMVRCLGFSPCAKVVAICKNAAAGRGDLTVKRAAEKCGVNAVSKSDMCQKR